MSLNKIKIALVQLNSCSTPELNFQQVEECFDQAAKQQAALVALPENFLVLGASNKAIFALDISSYISALKNLCLKYQIDCVAGSLPLSSNDKKESRRYSSCLYIDSQGEIVDRYNKIHLFDADVADEKGSYRESEFYFPGDRAVVVKTLDARMGLSICFDLRFPKLFQYYKSQQVDLLFVPSAFTQLTGEKHWEVLLRARAIENQCYIIAPNQTGTHDDGRKTWGHSMVVSPDGNILVDMGEQPGIAVCEINLNEVKATRSAIPLLDRPFSGC